jgi:hypothetical protein
MPPLKLALFMACASLALLDHGLARADSDEVIVAQAGAGQRVGPGARRQADPGPGDGGAVLVVPVRRPLRVAELDAVTGTVPIIDVHAHIRPGAGPRAGAGPSAGIAGGFKLAAERAASEMKRHQVVASVIMPPPNIESRGTEANAYAQALAPYDGMYIGAGGSSLNPMIEGAHRTGQFGPPIAARFRQIAERLSRTGVVVLGEFAGTHFSFFAGHPFEDTPVDHPLFLMLADIAAENDLPIDLHTEAVPVDMPMPRGRRMTSANPQTIKATLPGLEHLLAHNRGARVVWAHVGWDNTGFRSPEISRRLLAAHSNLFMSVKLASNDMAPENRPLTPSGAVKPEWLALFREFPDRFVIGSDTFYNAVDNDRSTPGDGGLDEVRRFVDALPEDVRRPIAYANAIRIYRLDTRRGGS